jgi:hypothetical protein
MKVLSEEQLNDRVKEIYKEEQTRIFVEKWNKLPMAEKLMVIEMYNILHPDAKIVLSESKWYNTVMDWAGLIPGIGSGIDLVNGFSYWRQGEKLYAILSWIGALPLFGDLISKPVMSVLKMGGRSVELFKGAVLAKDAVKIAESAKALGGPVAKMVETAPRWGEQLIKVLEMSASKVPWLGTGFTKTIKGWLELFGLAGKEMTTFAKMGRKEVRKLMTNTKWYMGFLDYWGLTNFKGSMKELNDKIPNLDQKMIEFMNTPEGQRLASTSTESPPPPPPPSSTPAEPSVAAQALQAYTNPVDFLVSLVK